MAWRSAAVAVAVVAAVGGCAAAPSLPAPEPTVPPAATGLPAGDGEGDRAEVPAIWDFTSVDLVTGEAVDGASFAGSNVVVWFWAPWCPTCVAEAPDVAAAQARLPEGVTLLGIPGNAPVGDSRTFVADHGVGTFTHLDDADGSLWDAFDVFAQPVFALVDEQGNVELILRTLDEEGIVAAAEELAAR